MPPYFYLLIMRSKGSKWLLALVIFSQLPWFFFLTYYNQAGGDSYNCCSITNLVPESKSNWNKDVICTKSECLDRLLFWNVPRQDHEDLIQLVRNKYIFPPDFSVPYNLSEDAEKRWDRSQTGQVPVVRDFLQNLTKGPGFFIECGANDGEFFTNTLWFERALGWNGLLIEAEPTSFQKLKSKHRRALISNTCLSPSIYPEKLSFFKNAKAPGKGGRDSLVKSEAEKIGTTEEVKIKCFPLFTLLAAINVFHVDFFSLDIEGVELTVLKTIPFDKISFKVLLIESTHMADKGIELHNLMKKVGYKFYKQLRYDRMYVHSSLVPEDFVELKV